ncbi:hypothetical protein [Patulibacter americanus]|uniref:hypothetical protein n=1 Tax=Patulibacter americanus TaxID=588672 RepID=UPI0004225CDF|nr:hypothetical protein [Patulibacter americanus]
MDTVRTLHTHEAGFGWFFTSPDVEGLTGSAPTYDEAHTEAEKVVRWHLAGEAKERGEAAPEVEFVHFVPDTAAAALAA